MVAAEDAAQTAAGHVVAGVHANTDVAGDPKVDAAAGAEDAMIVGIGRQLRRVVGVQCVVVKAPPSGAYRSKYGNARLHRQHQAD
jgi:hypothetical protein